MPGLTRSLAEFVHAPGFDALSGRAVEIAQSGFIDTVATLIAGREEPVVGIVTRFVTARGSTASEATVLAGTGRAASADAALINGTAGHALDFDDVAMGGHPSTVLVPTVLAEAEALGLGGADAVRAYLVGYEVWSELFRREPDAYHLKGWHPTAVLGTVAAAAASAHLRGLPVDRARHALSLAGSFAAGLVANFGTMTKPLHAGRAAASGIEAAKLAQAGLSAADDAIEHHAGYLAALSPKGKADLDAPVITQNRPLGILDTGLSIKKYPICYATHRVIDAVIDLAQAHDLQPEAVREVRAWIGVAQASMLRNHRPVTGLAAKFSLEFAVASSLTARSVGLAELTDRFVNQPGVQRLMDRVRIQAVDGERCPHEPVFALNDRIEIELTDGRVLASGDLRFARGNAMLPLKPADLKAKFLDCTRAARDLDAEAVFERLNRLPELPRIAQLFHG
jgi:2-methylcitrate dehydratase PrpD